VLPADRAFALPAGASVDEAGFVEPVLCCSTAVSAGLKMGQAPG
jgi:hypothetical protein